MLAKYDNSREDAQWRWEKGLVEAHNHKQKKFVGNQRAARWIDVG